MSENKKKYAYWMKPSMVEEMTEMLDTANATSKSDFVCQAVQFYIGYLHQKNVLIIFRQSLLRPLKVKLKVLRKIFLRCFLRWL